MQELLYLKFEGTCQHIHTHTHTHINSQIKEAENLRVRRYLGKTGRRVMRRTRERKRGSGIF